MIKTFSFKNLYNYIHTFPFQAPPIRICLLGPHGIGKTVCARWLAEKLNIFHIQFEERLQELIMLKTGKRVGLEEEEEEEEGEGTQELGESTIPESAPEFEEGSEEESKHIPEVIELLYIFLVSFLQSGK